MLCCFWFTANIFTAPCGQAGQCTGEILYMASYVLLHNRMVLVLRDFHWLPNGANLKFIAYCIGELLKGQLRFK